jgi:hypothetical protein
MPLFLSFCHWSWKGKSALILCNFFLSAFHVFCIVLCCFWIKIWLTLTFLFRYLEKILFKFLAFLLFSQYAGILYFINFVFQEYLSLFDCLVVLGESLYHFGKFLHFRLLGELIIIILHGLKTVLCYIRWTVVLSLFFLIFMKRILISAYSCLKEIIGWNRTSQLGLPGIVKGTFTVLFTWHDSLLKGGDFG